MKFFSVAICAGLIGLAVFPAPLLAQQKTVKACQEEWRANKADNQAKGVTEKDVALARKIEEMISWQPGREGGALEGTPQDERHGYLKYDA